MGLGGFTAAGGVGAGAGDPLEGLQGYLGEGMHRGQEGEEVIPGRG